MTVYEVLDQLAGEVRRLINCRLTPDTADAIIIQAGRPKGEV